MRFGIFLLLVVGALGGGFRAFTEESRTGVGIALASVAAMFLFAFLESVWEAHLRGTNRLHIEVPEPPRVIGGNLAIPCMEISNRSRTDRASLVFRARIRLGDETHTLGLLSPILYLREPAHRIERQPVVIEPNTVDNYRIEFQLPESMNNSQRDELGGDIKGDEEFAGTVWLVVTDKLNLDQGDCESQIPGRLDIPDEHRIYRMSRNELSK